MTALMLLAIYIYPLQLQVLASTVFFNDFMAIKQAEKPSYFGPL